MLQRGDERGSSLPALPPFLPSSALHLLVSDRTCSALEECCRCCASSSASLVLPHLSTPLLCSLLPANSTTAAPLTLNRILSTRRNLRRLFSATKMAAAAASDSTAATAALSIGGPGPATHSLGPHTQHNTPHSHSVRIHSCAAHSMAGGSALRDSAATDHPLNPTSAHRWPASPTLLLACYANPIRTRLSLACTH